MQGVFPRIIKAEAKDASGELVGGAEFEWFVNGTGVGSGVASNGHSTLEIFDSAAVVSVKVTHEGLTKGPVRLAQDQQLYEFNFEIIQHPKWRDFLMKHFPAFVGISFILLTIVLAFVFPNPNTLQTRLLLATFALGGGGFGGEIAGFLNTDLTLGDKLRISAGGAAAMFVILFFFVPATS